MEIIDPINLWRFGLGPRPRDLPACIVAPNDIPPFKVMKVDAAEQPVGSGSQIPRGPGGPSDQVPRGAKVAPNESG